MFVREQVTGNAAVQKKKKRRPLHVGCLEWCSCWPKRTGTTTRCEQTLAPVDSFLQPIHPVCCCVFCLFERVFLRLPPPSPALCFSLGRCGDTKRLHFVGELRHKRGCVPKQGLSRDTTSIVTHSILATFVEHLRRRSEMCCVIRAIITQVPCVVTLVNQGGAQ